MVSPTIRVAESSDVTELASLRAAYAEERKNVHATADPTFGERFSQWYRSTEATSRWWVAVTEHMTVGVVHMTLHERMPMPTYDPGRWGYISLLYVRPTHRGQSLGAQLLYAAERDAVKMGLSRVLLHPTEKAIPLYRRCGYQPADSYMVHSLTTSD